MSFFETSHLTKAFGGLIAVNDLSVRVEPGQIFGLIGPKSAKYGPRLNRCPLQLLEIDYELI